MLKLVTYVLSFAVGFAARYRPFFRLGFPSDTAARPGFRRCNHAVPPGRLGIFAWGTALGSPTRNFVRLRAVFHLRPIVGRGAPRGSTLTQQLRSRQPEISRARKNITLQESFVTYVFSRESTKRYYF